MWIRRMDDHAHVIETVEMVVKMMGAVEAASSMEFVSHYQLSEIGEFTHVGVVMNCWAK